MIEKCWCTDHERGNFALSIRTEPKSYLPWSLSVQKLPVRGKEVTVLGIFNIDDAYQLRDALDEFIRENE